MRHVTRAQAQFAGAQVAALLAGSWREAVEPAAIRLETLEAIAPRLLAAGAASLAWRRIRHSALAESAAGRKLRDAYRVHVLQAAVHERTLARVTGRLAAVGIEAVLVKGWAIARSYPEQGLRPCGDVDLCVSPADFSAAQSALPPAEFAGCVDLHRGFEKFGDRTWDDMLARSSVATVGGSPVRLLSADDHVCVLCLHFLRHGGWRALWLCDVALALESRPSGFDWDRVLGASRRQTEGIACTVGLAHDLLGARVDDTPLSARVRRLPRWLAPAVLREWGAPQRRRLPMASFIAQPFSALRESLWHFANPIEATLTVGGPWNNWPRLPLQIADAVLRTAKFAIRLPQHLQTQRSQARRRR
jgi:hypothetical protein